MDRPALEVADLFRAHGEAYRQTHNCSVHEQKVMRAIERCRTGALGGHIDACEACGALEISYNSCRNRYCPKCQGAARQQWIAAREAELLPIEYFHVVFTLPHALNDLVRQNRAPLLDLLFRAVSQTLLEFGRRHLQGEIGIVAVLHTWGQTLWEHYHVHCIVTGGALQLGRGAEGTPSTWRGSRRGFLFAVRALAEVYRGKYLAGLRRAYARGQLRLGGELAALARAVAWQGLVGDLYGARWVVYAKRPFAGPREVVRYLGRYTHRGPISNARLRRLEGERVHFVWKDYRDGSCGKEMELGAEEFIRRYLLHVLPPRFVRIRYYGLYARSKQRTHLALAQALLRARRLSRRRRQPKGQKRRRRAGAKRVSSRRRARAAWLVGWGAWYGSASGMRGSGRRCWRRCSRWGPGSGGRREEGRDRWAA